MEQFCLMEQNIAAKNKGKKNKKKGNTTTYLLTFLLLNFQWSEIVLAQEDLQDFDYWSSLCTSLAEAEKYEEALEHCDQAIALNPRAPQVWSERGDVLWYLKQYPESVASYEWVIKLDSRDSQAWTRRCMGLIKLDKYTEAINSCETALRVDENWDKVSPAIAWDNRGLAMGGLFRGEEALFSFDWATQINPDYSKAWADKCLLEYEMGNYIQALSSCDRALQSNDYWDDESPALAWTNRARVTQALGRYDEAYTSYNKALAFEPDNATIWTEIGVLLGSFEKYEEAKVAHDLAVTNSPNFSLALTNQCANLNHLGEYEEAFTACETAIQQGDGKWGKLGIAYAWNQQGNALIGLKKYEQALASFQRALTLEPDYASAWSNRSVSLWKLGRYNDAFASSERAIAINPFSSVAWYNHGRILTTLGKFEETVAAYNRALQGDANIGYGSTIAEIWINQSAMLWRLERYEEAITAADNALGINPDSSAAWYNRALALMSLKRYQQAVTNYDRAIRVSNKNAGGEDADEEKKEQIKKERANLLTGKGIALRFLREYPEAIAVLNQALELNPNNSLALLNRDIVQQRLLEQQKRAIN